MLVTSGMGARRAAEAARLLLGEYTPRWLISFGIAGAVEADLEIGDVVLAEAYCRLDGGIVSSLSPLATWSETALEAAVQALAGRGRRAFIGTAITTGGSQVSFTRLVEMRHPVLEMETAGIAQVAAKNGTPLLSLRAISDGPRAPLPLDLGEIMDEDSNLKYVKLLGIVLHNPKIIYQFRQVLNSNKVAADNAVVALVAVLSKLTD